jgi:hypothetical protein
MGDKRLDWVVLGRKIGTATGWDQADTFVMQIYDFEPADGVGLPASECLSFDFENGVAETYDEKGKTTESRDLVTSLFGIVPTRAA